MRLLGNYNCRIFFKDRMLFKLTKISMLYLWKVSLKYLELYSVINLIDIEKYSEIDIDII